jgi:hypothetical protein
MLEASPNTPSLKNVPELKDCVMHTRFNCAHRDPEDLAHLRIRKSLNDAELKGHSVRRVQLGHCRLQHLRPLLTLDAIKGLTLITLDFHERC